MYSPRSHKKTFGETLAGGSLIEWMIIVAILGIFAALFAKSVQRHKEAQECRQSGGQYVDGPKTGMSCFGSSGSMTCTDTFEKICVYPKRNRE